MRYYIIGNKDSLSIEYSYAEQWLKLNGNTVINPCNIRIDGIDNEELTQIKLQLLSFSDSVLVLDKSCDTYELSYAKALGKKVKYLSKQWKLKRKESRDLFVAENEEPLELVAKTAEQILAEADENSPSYQWLKNNPPLGMKPINISNDMPIIELTEHGKEVLGHIGRKNNE